MDSTLQRLRAVCAATARLLYLFDCTEVDAFSISFFAAFVSFPFPFLSPFIFFPSLSLLIACETASLHLHYGVGVRDCCEFPRWYLARNPIRNLSRPTLRMHLLSTQNYDY